MGIWESYLSDESQRHKQGDKPSWIQDTPEAMHCIDILLQHISPHLHEFFILWARKAVVIRATGQTSRLLGGDKGAQRRPGIVLGMLTTGS